MISGRAWAQVGHSGDTSDGHFVRLLWDAVQGEWGLSGGGMVTWRMTGTESHAFTFIMEGGETDAGR